MSTVVMDGVRQQLASLGLDGVALRGQSAEFEIARYDHWVNAGGGGGRVCTCTGTYKADNLSMRAA